MDIRVVSEAMAGLHDALKVIEMATELRMQTSRLRGLLPPNQLDDLTLNAVQVVQKLHAQLKEGLKD